MAFIDIIKYEGGNDVLVWKHPREDFNTACRLIVHETQEAALFRNGKLVKLFEPSEEKYRIETENIPFLTKASTLFTGGYIPNHYEIYFINKARVMNVRWGTSDPMTIHDPCFDLPFDITARGEFAVLVEDSEKLLKTRIGTTEHYTRRDFEDEFRRLLLPTIKGYISDIMINGETSFFEIDPMLPRISKALKGEASTFFMDYGLGVSEFVVEAISVVKDENYEKIRSYLTERGGQKILGYTWAQLQAYDVAHQQAANPGVPGTMAGIGIGAAAGLAGGQMIGGIIKTQVAAPIGQAMGNASPIQPDDSYGRPRRRTMRHEDVPAQEEQFCANCGKANASGGLFCPHCGSKL